jgi:hypothetical protein
LKILKGGSAEISPNRWKKFDIELDETDLQALVIKNNLDATKLSVGQKYLLLVKQAELLITLDMERDGLSGEESFANLNEKLSMFLDKLPKLEG